MTDNAPTLRWSAVGLAGLVVAVSGVAGLVFVAITDPAMMELLEAVGGVVRRWSSDHPATALTATSSWLALSFGWLLVSVASSMLGRRPAAEGDDDA